MYYVGSSTDVVDRWREHKRNLNANIHVNPKLQNSWNKHKSDRFEFVLVEEVTDKRDLLKVEQIYLDNAKNEKDRVFNLKFVARGWDWSDPRLSKSIRRGSMHDNYDTTVFSFKHNDTNEIFIGTRCDFYTKYKLDKSSLRRVIQGKFKTIGGWSLVRI